MPSSREAHPASSLRRGGESVTPSGVWWAGSRAPRCRRRTAARRRGRPRRRRRRSGRRVPCPPSRSRWRGSDRSSTAMRRARPAPTVRPSTTRRVREARGDHDLLGVGDDAAGPAEVLGEPRSAAPGLPWRVGSYQRVGVGVGQRPPDRPCRPRPGEQGQVGIAAGEVGEDAASSPMGSSWHSTDLRRYVGGTSPPPRGDAAWRDCDEFLVGPAARPRPRRCPWPGRGRRPGLRVDGSAAAWGQAAVDDRCAQACSRAWRRPPSGDRLRSSSRWSSVDHDDWSERWTSR